MAKHVLVIFNPVAKSQVNTEQWIGKLVEELNKKDEYLVSFYPTTANTGPEQLVPLFQPPLDLIIAAGGDGTARFTLAALAKAQSNIPVAIFPLGTGNVLARNLGVVEESLFANPLENAYDYILNGRPCKIDMGLMNGEFFAGMAGVGPISDAFMTPPREEKTKHKLLAYIKALVSTVTRRPFHFKITTEGHSFCVEASGIFVSNVEDLGIGKEVDLEVLADGYLNLHVVNPRSFKDYLGLGFRYAAGNEEHSPEYVLKVKEATIEVLPNRGVRSAFQAFSRKVSALFNTAKDRRPPMRELPCMIDGESCGMTPMRVVVVPNAVNALVPPAKLETMLEMNETAENESAASEQTFRKAS